MVNQQFTFAVHIMTCLAFSGGVMDSKTLAKSVNTNAVVVRRLLAALKEARLVETSAGKNGGARLRKLPGRISLLEIYKAVQPRPVIAVNERKAAKTCRVSCNMQRIMTKVAESAERAVTKRLRRITLQQLQRDVR
jgi:Rrf2 family protein